MKNNTIKTFCLLLVTAVMLSGCAEMRHHRGNGGHNEGKGQQERGRHN
ncbi:hypothetical protein [Pedobacter westerhofensis]|nr:hypothetical protein [Pedobacter westerhofensis]